jgi:hypothetical protein
LATGREIFLRPIILQQGIYGMVFQKLQEGRTAVKHFEDTCKRLWLAEKKGCKTPGGPNPSGSTKPNSPEV